MMPQRNPAPPKEPKWQAYEHDPGSILGWRIDLVLAGHHVLTLAGLDEPTACLIAAAPRKAALCEKLADALERLAKEVTELLGPINAADWDLLENQPAMKAAYAALQAAGRAPQ